MCVILTTSVPHRLKLALMMTWQCRHPPHRVAEYGLHGEAPAARQLPAGNATQAVGPQPCCMPCLPMLCSWHVSSAQDIQGRLSVSGAMPGTQEAEREPAAPEQPRQSGTKTQMNVRALTYSAGGLQQEPMHGQC